jgi:beta-glucosidase
MTNKPPIRPFSPDFLWGVGTSAYQIEGAVSEGGRGESIWDRFSYTPGNIADGSTADKACDHYHRYREDIDLLRWLGVNAYRFSIAWPRVIPDGDGRVNPNGLDFYDRLVDRLIEFNITPFITLFHWDLPQRLQDHGGWANRDTALIFADYAYTVVRRLGDRVKYWTTQNEMWCTAFLGHYYGIFAPGQRNLKGALQVAHHLLLSHGLAVTGIRGANRQAQVGIAPNLAAPYPDRPIQADMKAAWRYDGFFNRWFLDPLAGNGYPQDMWDYYGKDVPDVRDGDMETITAPIDYLGVNYYNPNRVRDDPYSPPPNVRFVPDPALERTADREIDASALYRLLLRLKDEYPFPALIVTENGAAFPDTVEESAQPGIPGAVKDLARIRFLKAHIREAARAIEAGINLKGYFIWTLMDNFEWNQGYKLRYGLFYTDFHTQRRIGKDSAHWLRRFLQGKEILS